MAILKDYEVAIVVDGQDLIEYTDEDNEEEQRDNETETENSDSDRSGPVNPSGAPRSGAKVINRYIEAKTGSKFRIRCTAKSRDFLEPRFAGVRITVWIDGQDTLRRTVLHPYPYHGVVKGRRYRERGIKYQQDFKFGDLKLCEEDHSTEQHDKNIAEKASKIGTICVNVHRADRIGDPRASRTEIDYGSTAITSQYTIHEKLVKGKAVSHQTVYDTAQPVISKSIDTTMYDDRDDPYLTFKFHYMSRTSLQVMGLIPRSPSPQQVVEVGQSGEDERPLGELSREEMMALINRQKLTIRNQRDLKRESSTARNVKRERFENDDELSIESIRSVRPRNAAPIVVDLTDG